MYTSEDFAQTQHNFAQSHNCMMVTFRSSGMEGLVEHLVMSNKIEIVQTIILAVSQNQILYICVLWSATNMFSEFI